MKKPIKIKELDQVPQPNDELLLINEQLLGIANRIDSIEVSVQNIGEYESRLQLIEARVQASIDLTDDIVGNTNNIISLTESRIESTLSNADMVLNHADFLSSTFLVILGLIITVASIVVTWVLGRRQEQHMKDAVAKVTDKLSKDDDFRDEFIRSLVSHEELRQNINYSIEQIARKMFTDASEEETTTEDFSDLKEQLDYTDMDDVEAPSTSLLSKIKGIFKNESK
jgi:hypothetical protein